MLYVLASSLWSQGSKGWPLKPFMQKEELLFKAKSSAKNCSEDTFYENVCVEANIISDDERTLYEMKQSFRTSKENGYLIGQMLSAWKILDSHFNSDISQYEWEDVLVTDLVKESATIISQHRLSVEALVYFWNCWKQNVVTIVEYLKCLETQNVKEFTDCEEFCLNYFGVRKQLDGKNIYHLLNPNADWVQSCDGKFVSLDAQLFAPVAIKYWYSELLSVGVKVLETLSALRMFSVKKSSSLFCQSMIAVHIFQVAKFFVGSKFYMHSTEIEGMKDFIKLSAEDFLENVFSPDWTKSITENMIALRGTGVSSDILGEVVYSIINSESELTYEKIGRVLVVLFGQRRLPIALYARIGEVFHANPSWKAVVNEVIGHHLTVDIENGTLGNAALISLLHEALRDTYDAHWRKAVDYIPPDCFIYILERQLVSVLYSQGCFYATKSSLVEWLMYEEWTTSQTTNLSSDIAISSGNVHDFVARSVNKLLISRFGLVEWFKRSPNKSDESYQLLVLRLVILMCLVCANTGNYFDMLYNLLGDSHISSKLPEVFHEILKRKRKCNFIRTLAEALVEIRNPLVIVCQESQNHYQKSLCADTIFVHTKNIRRREDVLKVVFAKNVEDVQDHAAEVKSCSCGLYSRSMDQGQGLNSPSSSSRATLGQHVKTAAADRGDEQVKKFKHLKKTFHSQESSEVGYDKDVRSFACNDPNAKVKWEKIVDCKNASTSQPSQNRFRNNKNGDILPEVNCMADEMKKLSVALDVSNPELVGTKSELAKNNFKKDKTTRLPQPPLMLREPEDKKTRKSSKQVKAKVNSDSKKIQNCEVKVSDSKNAKMKSLLHPQSIVLEPNKEGNCSKHEPLKARNKCQSGKDKMELQKQPVRWEPVKSKNDARKATIKDVVDEPISVRSGKKFEQVISPKKPLQAWEPRTDCCGMNCEQSKSKGSTKFKGLAPKAEERGENHDQVAHTESLNAAKHDVKSLRRKLCLAEWSGEGSEQIRIKDSNSKPCEMKSSVGEPNTAGNGKNSQAQQIGSKENPNSKKDEVNSLPHLPSQVWQPKAEGRGKKCKHIKSEESSGSKPFKVENLVGEPHDLVSGKNYERIGSKECPNSEMDEVKSLPDLPGVVKEPEDGGSGKNCERAKSTKSSISKPCSGSLKNCEQVICKMESESKCNQPKSKEKCEEKKQPLLVWEPKGTKK